jgi:hypothetical protein
MPVNFVLTRIGDAIGMSETIPSKRETVRAANRAAYAALTDAFHALPVEARDLVKREFVTQRATNPGISWARFLAVALPLLPAK